MDKKLKKIFDGYNFHDIVNDCIIPADIACILSFMVFYKSVDSLKILDEILTISLTILPIMATLLLTGYTIVLTLFWSEYGRAIRKYKAGKKLLSSLNSAFAASIIIMLVSLGLNIVVSVCVNINLELPKYVYAHLVNSFAIFIILLTLFYSLLTLKDIIKNIFNLGQTAEHFDNTIEKATKESKPDV